MSAKPTTRAGEIELAASAWLERRDGEDWNAAQEAELETWLVQSHAHRAAYWRLKAAWMQSERLVALKSVSPTSREERGRTNPIFSRIMAVCVVFAVGAAGTWFYLTQTAQQVYATSVGQHKIILLRDGSSIELNTDTRLRVALNSERKIWLDRGEAYFQIKHDEARPFLVFAGGHRVVDLGTAFLVRQEATRTEVALVQGRARFDSAATHGGSTILKPGDIVYASADAISVSEASKTAISDALGWRRGLIIFDHTTLADAATELNRYNTKQIVVLDPAAARLMIHGRFPANDTTAIVNVAREVFGLRVENRGSEILISR
jgi:transmembrane sensor